MENSQNKFLSGLEFSAEHGELAFNGVRYLLIRPETIVRFQKAAEAAFGPGVSELMYGAARDIGSSIGERYRKSGMSRGQAIESMLRSAAELGWARFSAREIAAPGAVLTLRAENSAFARAYGAHEHPVCHIIRGLFCGALCAISGPVKSARETKCLSTGAELCVFEFQTEAVSPAIDGSFAGERR